MDTNRALEIIRLLSDGIDPRSGLLFPSNSPYHHPDTVRALFKAVNALENLKEGNKGLKTKPRNVGKAWDKAEDNLLIGGFDEGMPVNELADRHMRTKGAIISRLVRLGRITQDASKRKN